MKVLVYAESTEGKFKKSSYETILYASKLAKKVSGETIAVSIGNVSDEQLNTLGKYGANKVLKVSEDRLNSFDSKAYSKVIAELAKSEGANIIVLSHNYNGKAIAPRLSVKLDAGLVSGAVELPNTDGSFKVKKGVFSGKAFAHYEIKSENKIISLMPNSIALEENNVTAEIVQSNIDLSDQDFGVQVKEVKKSSGKIPLTEAELVVSGGRGLKGPENWGMVEELAEVLGAGTASSRPVADMGWRPHEEHVGQTGTAIRPNLYIAIGISGAIQHLAGVNGSKTIVVINKDPEAPFFKAADYGIVGDAFEVVPKLTEAIKELKAS